MATCTVADCNRAQNRRQWCFMHYQRWKKNGDPTTTTIIRGDPVTRFWSKVDKSGDCWLWTAGVGTDGYGQFSIYDVNGQAHRYSYQLAHGPIPAGQLVCHRCDNPPCVRPDHLFLGSQLENTRDKIAKGRARYLQGEATTNARLTEDIVRTIRRLYAAGHTQQSIGERYGLKQPYVSLLVLKKRWAHVS